MALPSTRAAEPWILSKAVLDNPTGCGNLDAAIEMKAAGHLFVSSLVFLGAWLALTRQSMADMDIDVDLGIATANLSVADNLAWNLPLAIAIWLVFEGGLAVALLASRGLTQLRRRQVAGGLGEPK